MQSLKGQFLVAMFDHDTVVMVMPAIVPATIMVMPAVAALDHDLFGISNGRRRDRNRTNSGNNISKLLHGVLLLRSED